MKFSNKNHSPSCVSFSINGYTMSVKTPLKGMRTLFQADRMVVAFDGHEDSKKALKRQSL